MLLALADANYELIWVDMGANSVCSDSQIWNTYNIKGHILGQTARFPGPSTLPSDDKLYPHSIIADDAFALRDWMLKPFGHRSLTEPECIFKYRFSRARRNIYMQILK